jgi:hypothetical protein
LNQCFIGKDVQVICAYFICIFSSSTINNWCTLCIRYISYTMNLYNSTYK